MRILLISHWYKPVKSPVKRMARIAEYLSQDHNVTVLTSLPSYPTGVLPEEYRGKLWDISLDGRVKIIRVWDLPTPNRGFFRRTINHLVFVISTMIAIFFMKPFDTIIVSSPNFFSGLSGIFATLISKGNFIFDVRDLWPDSAFELGYKPKSIIIKPLKILERFYYKRAKKIFCATGEIRNTIIKMGVPQEKVVTLVNTVDINLFKPKKIIRAETGFDIKDFVVIYVGSLTQVQNLKTVIEAGKILRKYPEVKIIMVGEGEDKENLIAQKEKLKLNNLIFIDGQPTDKIIDMINASDIGLISLSTNKFFSDNALPTKTSEYLGCGKPIVACAGKNLKELIEENKVGIVVSPGDSEGLAKAILRLKNNKKMTVSFSENARNLAVKQFSDKNFYRILQQNF